MKPFLNTYLKKRASFRNIMPHFGHPLYDAALVIPAMSENNFIDRTLLSLKTAMNLCSKKILILVIVNNPPQESCRNYNDIFEDNQLLLEKLSDRKFDDETFRLFYIDASTPGNEIPADHGVGGARKTGCDSVLKYLDWSGNPLIFFLDADTIVPDNYFSAAFDFFSENKDIAGAYFKYHHQKGESDAAEFAIRLYEEYLRHFVESLNYTGTPYAYQAVGSTIVCRAENYVKAGGVRPKQAGEDFYFLQALCKTSMVHLPIREISSCTIFPSSRRSFRVPFGTGAKMNDLIPAVAGSDCFNQPFFYNPEIFKILKQIIDMTNNKTLFSEPEKSLEFLPPPAQDFLEKYKFLNAWNRILDNTPDDPNRLVHAFHTWFDAFKILKFVHFCEAPPYSYKKTSQPYYP
jgi:hypothetical protein